jgi:hypothetical protein
MGCCPSTTGLTFASQPRLTCPGSVSTAGVCSSVSGWHADRRGATPPLTALAISVVRCPVALWPQVLHLTSCTFVQAKFPSRHLCWLPPCGEQPSRTGATSGRVWQVASRELETASSGASVVKWLSQRVRAIPSLRDVVGAQPSTSKAA